jgi:hypothetical protein
MNIKDKKIEGELLELASGEGHILGPNLELLNCVIVCFSSQRGIAFAGVKMRGGEFIQKNRLIDMHFNRVSFQGVKFLGEYVGCDFGNWDDKNQSVNYCDFIDSYLHNCRFINCDITNISIPTWPFFSIINPYNVKSDVTSLEFPNKLKEILEIYTDNDIECVAIVADARIIANDIGSTVEDVRNYLNKIPLGKVRF